jgi:spermidine/putrescine transport system substrate-binding protein
MSNEIDPRLLSRLAANRTSRRRFIGGGAAATAAAILGPSFLSACSSGDTGSSTTTAESNALRISNWPFYMADGFIAAFQTASGLTVDYKEDFNDNEQWFAKVKEPLSRKQDIGADIVVPSEFMALRVKNLGWLNEISDAGVPNRSNLRQDLLDSASDPGRKFTAPYMSGMVGLAYNKAATGRPITKIEDLWDPAFSGKVSMLSDMQDGLGMVMLSQGGSPESPTSDSIKKAVDLVREHNDRGQIRRFTGNDYGDDLAAGNVVIAQAYSGDVIQLQADNPDLEFIVPEAGGTWFVDEFIIPHTTQNQSGAEAWIDYVYDRANYAKLIDAVQFVPVLSDMTDELNKVNPELGANPLINPSADMLGNLKSWPYLDDQQTQEFNTLYASVTGG